jgi:carboxypeptidase family protein
MKLAAVAIVAALTIGCGSAGGGTTATGLRGLVKRGPITPVCRQGQPCDVPAPGVKLVFTRSGKVVATATTNAKGWYRITLRPGRYAVRTNRRGFERRTQPAATTVPRDRIVRRDFFIDTGIR